MAEPVTCLDQAMEASMGDDALEKFMAAAQAVISEITKAVVIFGALGLLLAVGWAAL